MRTKQAAENHYGNGGAPLGGRSPGPAADEDDQWVASFESKFNSREPVTVRDINEYVAKIGGRHLLERLSESSSIFKRNGITAEAITPEAIARQKSARESAKRAARPRR